MYKRILFFSIILATFVILPNWVFAGAADERPEIIETGVFDEIFASFDRPVLLKYIAEENNCTVKTDAEKGTVSVVDKDGKTLKTYSNTVFMNGEPIADAGVLERDFGWTSCRHALKIDRFVFEADAVTAGGLTVFDPSASKGDSVYYVGKCWDGFYFVLTAGEHAKGCNHELMPGLFYEKEIIIRTSLPLGEEYKATDNEVTLVGTAAHAEPFEAKEAVVSAEPTEFSEPSETIGTEESSEISELVAQTDDFAAIFYEGFRPVMLEYIMKAKGYRLSYNAENDKFSIYGKDGALVTRLEGIPMLYGNRTLEATTLERAFGFECSHKADFDLFYTEADAVTAGWLTYYAQSRSAPVTFFVGSCPGGYYFSALPGNHAAICKYNHDSRYYRELSLTVENGAVVYGNAPVISAPERDVKSFEFAEYELNSRRVTEDKPEDAQMKMVVLSNVIYANENGNQSEYFAYRDQVYRDFWNDVANYDVNDYVFIPPDFPILESYDGFSHDEALVLSEAVKKLLKQDGQARIWIGTPGVTSMNYSHSAIKSVTETDFLERVKQRLGNSIWNNNVVGIYINQEAIYSESNRYQIERIKKTVGYFKEKNPGKKALWIPYYDLAADSNEISVKIAEVSRIPDLFDYIIIQPGYFFFDRVNGQIDPSATSHRKQNLAAIINSVENNYVSDSLGEPVDEKISNAQIGFEMEPQASYFSNSLATREESIDRYTQYLMAGAKIKDSAPLAYYIAGDPHINREALLYKFYEADEADALAVRKKLDDSLSNFYTYVFQTREKDKFFTEYAKELYLAASSDHTEEGFRAAFVQSVIIPEFYKYEKNHGIDDLVEYIKEGRDIQEYFIYSILRHLGYEPEIPQPTRGF